MTKKLLPVILVLLLALPSYAYMPDGCVGNWKLHGLPVQRRGTIVDESGNNHNGTVYGVPALYFDGTNDEAEVATPWDSLGGHRYMWFALRLHPNAQAATRCLWFDGWNSGGAVKVWVIMDATDCLIVYARAGAAGDVIRTATSTGTIAEGSWHSLLLAIDLGSDGTVANGAAVYAWIDGSVFAMGALSGDLTQGTFAADVSSYQGIGEDINGAWDWAGYARWIGMSGMDALPTIVDAQRFHDNPQAWLTQSGLDAYWYCNEGSGPVITDNSGNGHTLALTGATWDVTTNGGNAQVNADTTMGISTTAAGYVDLTTTAKVAEGPPLAGAAASSTTTLIHFYDSTDRTAYFPVNTVVENTADSSWHRITASAYGEYGGGSADDVQLTVTPAASTQFDGLAVTAYKGQLQLLTEDAFAICMWWKPRIASSGTERYISNELASMANLFFWRNSASGAYLMMFKGTANAQASFTGHTDGVNHSFTGVFDTTDSYAWIDKTDEKHDASYSGLHGGNPDIIRLGSIAYVVSGATDTFGPFCLLDLSDITGGVDTEVRESIRDVWDGSYMDWEVFFAALLVEFDAWTGPSNGDTITVTYWKCNEVPYGTEVDTDNIISRYTRVLTRGSALPAEGAADATDSDTENCTGIPLTTLGDSFTAGGLWIDQAQLINFGDHADFSFAGGGDTAFSFVIWSDADVKSWTQTLLAKSTEYSVVIGTDGKITFTLTDAESDTISTVSDNVLADGTLHCWAFTYTGAGIDGSNLSIYEDGVVVASTDAEAGVYGDMPDSANSLIIGPLTKAYLYDAFLCNRELPAAEVKSVDDGGMRRVRSSQAVVYYVDATNGSDVNSGLTIERPWKTIAKVNAASFDAGESVLFKRGETWREELTVPSSGSAGNPITFGAYGTGVDPIISGADVISGNWAGPDGNGEYTDDSIDTEPEIVIVDGTFWAVGTVGSLAVDEWGWDNAAGGTLYTGANPAALVVEAGQRLRCVFMANKSYITVRDLHLKYANGYGFNIIQVSASHSHNVVENCTVQECYLWCYSTNTSDNIIRNCTFFQNSNTAAVNSGCIFIGTDTTGGHLIEYTECYGSNEHGIYINNVGNDNNVVRYCTLHDNADQGLKWQNGSSGNTLECSLLYGNGQYGVRIGSGTGGESINNTVSNCVFYNNAEGGIHVRSDYTGIGHTFKNNIFYHNAVGFVGCVSFQAGAALETIVAGVTLENNCYYAPNWAQTGKVITRGAAYKSLSEWQSEDGHDSASINSDPLFVDAANGDFHLQVGSPAIDTGTDIDLAADYDGVAIPQGAAPDIGAYER